MSSVKAIPFVICIAAFMAIVLVSSIEANPQIDIMGGYDLLGVCINNCAQCKKMFGEFFEGHLCAEACIQFKGRMVPDCEDINSIGKFLNKLN
ncbi:eclosion hormone-like [Ochlerotatus camptorhynchus]|uniref:eclosion hormone-like n=1 Tax=Ochlerotatus camptorhynchus TaxID=644619 RepID=UPI0031CDB830